MRLDYQILLKSLPLTLLAGSVSVEIQYFFPSSMERRMATLYDTTPIKLILREKSIHRA